MADVPLYWSCHSVYPEQSKQFAETVSWLERYEALLPSNSGIASDNNNESRCDRAFALAFFEVPQRRSRSHLRNHNDVDALYQMGRFVDAARKSRAAMDRDGKDPMSVLVYARCAMKAGGRSNRLNAL